MEQLREVQEYLSAQADAAFAQAVCPDEKTGGVLIRLEEFAAQPQVLQKLIIRRCLEQVCGGLKDIGQSHVEAVRELFGKQAGRRRDLPCAVCAVRVYEGVLLQKKKENKTRFFRSRFRFRERRRSLRTAGQSGAAFFRKEIIFLWKIFPKKYTRNGSIMI
jgi:tRNA(Ile)-lysidine synthase